jgi:hypothetical protein
MQSCSSGMPQASDYVPADIKQPCTPLPIFGGATTDDLIDYNLYIIGLYKDCSIRHAGV